MAVLSEFDKSQQFVELTETFKLKLFCVVVVGCTVFSVVIFAISIGAAVEVTVVKLLFKTVPFRYGRWTGRFCGNDKILLGWFSTVFFEWYFDLFSSFLNVFDFL